MRRRFRIGCGLSLVAILAARLPKELNAQLTGEYQVKAAFLFNFARFVDWPADALRDPEEPFAICVLGQDPFGQAIDNVVAGKLIDGRPLKIKRFSDARKVIGCRILFVCSSEGKRVLSVLAAAKHPGMLTVAEAGSSTSESAVITFTINSDKVRFDINMAAAEEEKLRLSSKLLSLATVVKR